MDDTTFIILLAAWGTVGWIFLGAKALGRLLTNRQPGLELAEYFEATFPNCVDEHAEAEAWGIFTQGANAMLMETLKITRHHGGELPVGYQKDIEALCRQWLPPKKLGGS